jgi:peptidoglycan/xylan/chitin deacetylase (PgdA/CDA1 family)
MVGHPSVSPTTPAKSGGIPWRAHFTQPLRKLVAEPVFALARLRRTLVTGFPILAYHSVSQTEGDDAETVSPRAFADQLAWLKESGVSVVTVSELTERMRHVDDPALALSFDDGYADNLTHAWPVLATHGFRATVYVASAYIGKQSTWNREDYIGHRPMLSSDGIRELSKGGIEIGSHSHSHVDLTSLNAEAVTKELSRSRDALSQIVQKPVSGFAAPFGRANAALAEHVKRSGYQHMVVGGRFVPNAAEADMFRLRRITVARADTLREFAKKVAGAYRWLWFRESEW